MVQTSSTANKRLTKCPTGIRGLDDITYGGLPQGRPTLVCGRAGCGKTLMGMEFLVRGAVEFNEPGVFISLEESTHELTQNVASLGWDLEDLVAEKRLVLDYIPIERTQFEEAGEYDLEALFVRIGYAIDRIQAKRVVIDTLETLFGNLSDTALVRAELRRLFLWLKAKGVTAIITAESGGQGLTRHGIEEYVSDCVMVLDQRIQHDLATRRLHIVKYRGSQHSSNEYPFLIESDGIVVLPLTSVDLDYGVSSERISTGINRLDTMLGGQGIYRGSTTLISGTSGTGKSSLSGHFAAASCDRNERCLYVAFEESAQQIIRNMHSIGLDLATPQAQGLLKFHALRPTFYGLEMHLVKICQLVQDFGPSTVIFDPISSLTTAGLSHHIQSFLMRLVDFLKTRGITTVLTNLTSDGTPLESTDIGISSLMDTWLLLRDQEINGERNRLLYILKARGTHHSNQVREFRMTSQGIDILDVYLGPDGIVTGTARLVKEAQAAAEALARREAIERKQHEIERKRLIVEAQIQALRAEFEAEKEDVERLISQAQQHESQLLNEQRSRAKNRYAEDAIYPTIQPS